VIRTGLLIPIAVLLAFQSAETQDLRVELVWEIGGIDGPPEVMWQRIEDAAILHGSIYVVDMMTPSVRQFSLEGTFVAELGRSGEGPGEFLRPSYVSARGDSVGVYDWGQRRWAIFDQSGEHLVTYTPPHPRGRYTGLQKPLSPVAGFHLALTGWVNDESVEYPNALIHWKDPEVVDTLSTIATGNLMFSFRGDPQWHSTPWSVGAGGGFDEVGGSLVVLVNGFKSRATVYRRTLDGIQVERLLPLPGAARILTEEEKQAIAERFFELSNLDPRSRDIRVPDTLSAFTAVRGSGGNTVWLRRGGSGRLLGGAERWVKWTMTDDSFAELALPDGVEGLDVSANLFLAIRTGAYDEQYLQLFRIIDPDALDPYPSALQFTPCISGHAAHSLRSWPLAGRAVRLREFEQ